MNKYKIEKKGGMTKLVIPSLKGQQLSERELYAVSNGQISGLLRVEVSRKANSFKLLYNISGYISLREFLYNPLNKDSFANLLGNILKNLKALQNAYFNQQYLLMDLNVVMVSPTTQEICFVYVPITFFESGTNLKDFLLSIIECASFVNGEDTTYVREYIRILNSGINFSVFDLEEYIERLKRLPKTRNGKKCPKCGGALNTHANYCPLCGMRINSFAAGDDQGVYDPLKEMCMPSVQQPKQEPAFPAQLVQLIQPFQSVQPMIGARVPSAYLIRKKTGERISISGQTFKLGKDPATCQYCIRDNSTISRNHAVIRLINGRWYIGDLGSTNKSYLNAVMIQPGIDAELASGNTIRLSDEDFDFYIN